MKQKHLIIACSFLLLGTMAMAQSTGKYGLPSPKDYDKWSAGISFGQTFFFGDVLKDPDKNNNAFKNLPFTPGFGIQITRQVSHSVGLRIGGAYGTLEAGPNRERVSKKIQMVNAKLESRTMEGTFEGIYTFGNISHLKRNKKFHFYATLGIGMFNFDGELAGVDSLNNAIKLESGSVTELMIPFSLGIKYQIKKFDLGLSYDFRKTFTDKVDLVRDPLSEYDSYAFLRLNLNYTFGKKNKAMEWVNPLEVVYNDIADLNDRVDLLSGDKDKDGVADIFDKDNSTPEGVKVYGDGTAIDTDGDGIPDYKDGDPYSLKNAKVDANGVEIDTDGDGVPDSRDLEPGTPKGTLVNFQGVAIEGKDGAAGTAGVSYLPSIFFDVNKADIKQVYKDRILIVARAMKMNPNIRIMISGNADRTGGEALNDKLGQKRADAVKNHLVKVYGIEESRISTETKGEREPMANEANRPMNRRVDFSVIK
jgi:OmpA-OmpF porin, OOP family